MRVWCTPLPPIRLQARIHRLICTAVALSIVVAAEIRKAVLRRTAVAVDAG